MSGWMGEGGRGGGRGGVREVETEPSCPVARR